MRQALAILLAVLALPAAAAGVDVYLFWRVGCPHCEREIEFLDRSARCWYQVHERSLPVPPRLLLTCIK